MVAAAVFVFLIGGFFTVNFRAFYLRHPLKTLRAMPLENGAGQMLLSLGGTVGVGNIAGVAVALRLGGSGAVFWMWIGALFSMALKYAEITLGMLFRGGAAYYIKDKLGSLAAAIFSVLLICDAVTMGGMVQSSAISESAVTAFGISPVVIGVLLSLTAAAVFFFNVDLFRLSAYVVPLMSGGYILAALAVIAVNAHNIPTVLCDIVRSAFAPRAGAGGVLGILLSPALRQGIVKGLFSNEAGCGTAPLAHAASSEKEPSRQALFGIFEVFVDTILMCTLTAFTILLTLGDISGESGGTSACAAAFATLFGNAAPAVLSVFVTLFAFCTVISFGYYALESLAFFKRGANLKGAFLIVYCMSLFVGATAAPSIIWEICDIVVCFMLIINTTAVLLSHKSILAAHKRFYVHIGKYASSASRTRSRSSGATKNAIPMSDTDKKRGEMS